MTPEVIQEARRLIHDLIFQGRARTQGGRTIEPKDEVMVTMLEKVASKRLETVEAPQTVEGFVPQETYRALTTNQTPTRD